MFTNESHFAFNRAMTRDWCCSHVYRNGALERIENDYGFWADSCYHYRIADYQGNVRAVIGAGGALEEVNGYYPYGGLLGAPATGVQARGYFWTGYALLIICRPDGAKHNDSCLYYRGCACGSTTCLLSCAPDGASSGCLGWDG